MSSYTFKTPVVVTFVAIVCFAGLPPLRAVTPAPDGAYPNYNTAEGDHALFSLTDGHDNTAIGSNTLYSNTTGNGNTALGSLALDDDTGSYNTACGAVTLANNMSGVNNTAVGYSALYNNGDGNSNTSVGYQALLGNISGSFNTAIGSAALSGIGSVDSNTAVGYQTLYNNQSGSSNTGTGTAALYSNTSGYYNLAEGSQALYYNTTGYQNAASGMFAAYRNQVGHDNSALGFQALVSSKGSNNVGIGSNAGANLTTGSNNIDIGANVPGIAGEANTIRVGKQGTQKSTFIAGIAGTAATGSTVVVSSAGKLGVAASSARFKEAIKPMEKTSEAILALKPVTFHYKEEVDPDKIPQFGLVAEEVDKVDPQLVVHDVEGKPFTVRYEAVNAMLLNEFLKEHHKVQQLEANAVEEQKEIKALAATLKDQASQIQKVGAEVELSKAVPQTTANNP